MPRTPVGNSDTILPWGRESAVDEVVGGSEGIKIKQTRVMEDGQIAFVGGNEPNAASPVTSDAI